MLTSVLRRIRRHRATRSRGQSLVEFALILPVLLLLTLIALDFGRVYLGYINLQNMTRIAANYAANNPDAWGGTPDTTVQTRYLNQVRGDASATNCALPPVDQWAPAFADDNADGTSTGLGDTVMVQITCRFSLITPVISSILGGTINVTAESNFPVKSGLSAVAAGGGGGGSDDGGSGPNAAFTGNGVVADTTTTPTLSNTTPFAVEFRDTSGGAPDNWAWDFGDDTTSALQDPLVHTFTCTDPPCTFNVSMRASNTAGSSTARMTVIVVQASEVDFTANRQVIDRGQSVTFQNASTAGGTAYAWTFGDGGTGTGTSPSHTYNTVGTFNVSLTVTYPSPTGPVSLTKSGFITVNVGMCTVPKLNGTKFNDALAIWQGNPYKFTGTVIRGPGAPFGNFSITAQDLTATSLAPCNSSVTVNRP